MTGNVPFVHATALVEEGAHLGAGCKIWHQVHIMAGAWIGPRVVIGKNGFVASTVVVGESCRIQNNVSLYDGVTLGAGVFVGPSAVFTNVKRPRARFPRRDTYAETRVDDDATIGANATILCGTHIAEAAMIAAGAVVTCDVPAFCLVGGAPARRMGWVCRCGEALVVRDDDSDHEVSCDECGRDYSFSHRHSLMSELK
ncbi:MAG: acyltransferase [Planctomycetota bacterium]